MELDLCTCCKAWVSVSEYVSSYFTIFRYYHGQDTCSDDILLVSWILIHIIVSLVSPYKTIPYDLTPMLKYKDTTLQEWWKTSTARVYADLRPNVGAVGVLPGQPSCSKRPSAYSHPRHMTRYAEGGPRRIGGPRHRLRVRPRPIAPRPCPNWTLTAWSLCRGPPSA
jgi:hypothetical protein